MAALKPAEVVLALLLTMATAANAGPMPSNVRVRMTSEGPVFTTAQGMTLYRSKLDIIPGKSNCTDMQEKFGVTTGTSFSYPLPGEHRATCVKKTPPLLAAPTDAPVGKWQIIGRENGSRQWTYLGAPLYTATADRVPGDTNEGTPLYSNRTTGPVTVALAPLDVPPGITFAKSPLGIILTTSAGKPIYINHADRSPQSVCSGNCARHWLPLIASVEGARVAGERDWTANALADGSAQWMYKGRPLYTKLEATNDDGESARGWMQVILWPLPEHPAEIGVRWTNAGRVYTDKDGRTLYNYFCVEETKERTSCDRQGDPTAYYFSLCGGQRKCGETWHPLLASSDAKQIGNLWSVAVIDPANPLRALSSPRDGVRVWTYKGRPLFTYAGDYGPGDLNGDNIRTWAVASWSAVFCYGNTRDITTLP